MRSARWWSSSPAASLVGLTLVLVTGSGCKQVRNLFLGDPSLVPDPVVPAPPPAATPKPLVVAPRPPEVQRIKLANGQLASPEYSEAYQLHKSGQLWRAQLVLSAKAFSPTGTPEELELLGQICRTQRDEECQKRVAGKLSGYKYESDLDQAKRLLKKDPKAARDLLLPKVEAEISLEEQQVLTEACEKARDKECLEKIRKVEDERRLLLLRDLALKDAKEARKRIEARVKAKTVTERELAFLCELCDNEGDPHCRASYCKGLQNK
jgi:hypothetical protein